MFVERFTDENYRQKLAAEYRNIRQRNNESTHQYVERFQYLMTQRDLADDNQEVVDHCLQGLPYALRNEMLGKRRMQPGTFPDCEVDSGVVSFKSVSLLAASAVETARMMAPEPRRADSQRDYGYGDAGGRGRDNSGRFAPGQHSRLSQQRHRDQRGQRPSGDRSRTSSGGNADGGGGGPGASYPTPIVGACWECGVVGHKSTACPRRGTSSNPAARAEGGGQRRPHFGGPPRAGVGAATPPAVPAHAAAVTPPYRSRHEGTDRRRQLAARAAGVSTSPSRDLDEESDYCDDDESNVLSNAAVNMCDGDGAELSANAADDPVSGFEVIPPVGGSPAMNLALPSSVLDPKRAYLVVTLKNRVLTTLVDTGAVRSFIDAKVVDFLQLPVERVEGNIRLAADGKSVPREGKVTFTALYTFLGAADGRPPVEVQHEYDVMALDKSYHMLIGMDVIKQLWPDCVPTVFMKDSPTFLPQAQVADTPSASAAAASVTVEDVPDGDESTVSISLCQRESTQQALDSMLAEAHQDKADYVGTLPEVEQASRCVASTDAELEEEFRRLRD